MAHFLGQEYVPIITLPPAAVTVKQNHGMTSLSQARHLGPSCAVRSGLTLPSAFEFNYGGIAFRSKHAICGKELLLTDPDGKRAGYSYWTTPS